MCAKLSSINMLDIYIMRSRRGLKGQSTDSLTYMSWGVRLVVLVGTVAACLLVYWLQARPFTVLYNLSETMFRPGLVWGGQRARYGGAWSPYMDVLPEDEALAEPPLADANLAVAHMQATLHNGKDKFSVGDDIQVDICLYNGYGNIRPWGGDHIRVRMTDLENHADVSGYVIDHGNGSYTGYIKALWEGSPVIFTELIYTREEVAYLYELRRKLPTLRTISACFTDKKRTETTACLPFPERLPAGPGVCDLTSLNDGLPWYCAMPTSPDLTCQHFSWLARDVYNRSDIENAVHSPFWRNRTDHGTEIQTYIKGNKRATMLMNDKLKPTCCDYDFKRLWTQQSPIGYFYSNKWKLTHCKTSSDPSAIKCIRNTTLFLYGDSTVKQWFRELQDRFNCTNDSEHRNDRLPVCWNSGVSLTMYFIRHSLPGNIIDGVMGSVRLEEALELTAGASTPVFLLHLYSHYTYYHHSVYRDRIRRLRNTIETILKNRPRAKFLFKGPHTMYSKYLGVSDYYALVYRLILIEELEGLHDKVIYLDFKDMSIAKLVEDIHPKAPVVRAMVDEMLAYLC